MDRYVIIAQILLKLDQNLKKMRHELVPELIEEDEFWRNYFYKIECAKAELGVKNELGSRIDPAERARLLQQREEMEQVAEKQESLAKKHKIGKINQEEIELNVIDNS